MSEILFQHTITILILLFWLLIILGMGLFARLALKDLAFPALSILIFLSIPSVFAVSHTAYNDLFVSLFTLAAFYCFLRWPEEASAGEPHFF